MRTSPDHPAASRPQKKALLPQIKKLARRGLSSREIAAQVGIGKSTVAKWLRAAKIPPEARIMNGEQRAALKIRLQGQFEGLRAEAPRHETDRTAPGDPLPPPCQPDPPKDLAERAASPAAGCGRDRPGRRGALQSGREPGEGSPAPAHLAATTNGAPPRGGREKAPMETLHHPLVGHMEHGAAPVAKEGRGNPWPPRFGHVGHGLLCRAGSLAGWRFLQFIRLVSPSCQDPREHGRVGHQGIPRPARDSGRY